jgi:polyisoprenoid-binding protein YceI
MTFRSTSVRQAGEGWEVDGDLTIRGTTLPVTLDVEFEGAGPDAWGGTRAAFSARTEIDRTRFGLTWNQAVETGSLVVSKKVTIEIDVQLVRQA